jgi:hypothetical protein
LHWFDDFTKAVAGGRPSRSAMLDGLARLAAGAALAPLAAGATPAFARAGSAVGGSRRPTVPGISRKRRWNRPGTLQRGPCSFTAGSTNSLNFSATSSSLQFSLSDSLTPEDSSRAPSLGGHLAVDVTDGGESVLHVESQFAHWHPSTEKALDATLTFRYGSKVRGISNATLSAQGGRIGGTIDGRALTPFEAHGAAPSSIRLSDDRKLAVDADPDLRDKLSDLAAVVKHGFESCGSTPKLQHVREHRPPEANSSLRSPARATRAFDLAQVQPASGYIPGTPTGQNTGIFVGEETPNCYNAFTNAGTLVAGCIAGAIAGGFLCPPCAAYAVFGCYTAYAGALAAMELPGGACEQVPCSSGNAIPNSCDNTFTCCGQYECCPSGDFCAPMGICCPSSATVVCGTTYDDGFCCPSDTICGPGQTCVGCPQGQVAQNGQCCNFLCGNDCCQSSQATCDHAAGKCVYPSFGTPQPQPTRRRSLLCIAGGVACAAPNYDGTTTEVCCSPKVNCCAGKCCPPGQICGGGAENFGCGVWIR